MKKIIGLLFLLLLCGTVQAEMQWLGLNPTCQAGNAGDSGQVTNAGRGDAHKGWSGNWDGFEIELKIVDSAGGGVILDDDSSYGTYYTHAVNTEDVVAATGLIQLISITDTSAAATSLFGYGGDSTFVRYTVKTGYVPYDADAHTLVYDDVSLNAESGTATRDPLTFNTAVGDTLFKPWTWMEITCWDSTLWGEKVSGPFEVTGTPVATASITAEGTYEGSGELGRFHVTMFGCAADDPDSIIWIHYGNQGHVTSYGTTAVTGAAQELDSGVTVTFDDATTGTDDDVFMFHVSDSLHYGKTVKYKIRAGLDLQRR